MGIRLHRRRRARILLIRTCHRVKMDGVTFADRFLASPLVLRLPAEELLQIPIVAAFLQAAESERVFNRPQQRVVIGRCG